MDNLESQVYEVFEKDPIKYIQYEEAVFRALTERFKDTDQTPFVFDSFSDQFSLSSFSLFFFKIVLSIPFFFFFSIWLVL